MTDAKLAKVDPKIEYDASGGKTGHRCGVCSMYREPNQCTLVAGYIRPEGVCKRFEKTTKPAWKS